MIDLSSTDGVYIANKEFRWFGRFFCTMEEYRLNQFINNDTLTVKPGSKFTIKYEGTIGDTMHCFRIESLDSGDMVIGHTGSKLEIKYRIDLGHAAKISNLYNSDDEEII